jgi:hypothetical protein
MGPFTFIRETIDHNADFPFSQNSLLDVYLAAGRCRVSLSSGIALIVSIAEA